MTTSCASPTASSFTRGGQLGQARFPPRLLLTPQHPLSWMLRALPRPDAGDVLASARARRDWNDVEPRAPWREATRPPTR
jgi:hypothetical protein